MDRGEAPANPWPPPSQTPSPPAPWRAQRGENESPRLSKSRILTVFSVLRSDGVVDCDIGARPAGAVLCVRSDAPTVINGSWLSVCLVCALKVHVPVMYKIRLPNPNPPLSKP